MKIYIHPAFDHKDEGDGGVRRVVEAQKRGLAELGWEIVTDPEAADIIGCHIMLPPQQLLLYPDKPIVAFIHGLYWKEYDWSSGLLKVNGDVAQLIRVADAICSPSEWVSNSIRRNFCRPVFTIPHGIDAAEWETNDGPHEKPYVLWNKNRPDPVCDPEPLNKVAMMLHDIQFVASFGEERHNMSLTGRVGPDVARRLVQRASVYLATSRETFGIGTLEALAAGVPVVGYDWGGQHELAEGRTPEQCGMILVRPDDEVELAKAIDRVMRDKKFAEQMSAAAKATAAKYPWSRAMLAYQHVLEQVLADRAHRKASPRTSIVITNYNLGRYLPDAIRSVKEQTDNDWECLLVDDASPESDGREIMQAAAASDHRFRVIFNTENQYLAEARNIAIRQASGRYIMALDADDMLTPDAVSILAGELDKDRTMDVAYGRVFFTEEDGRTPSDYGFGPGRSQWPIQFNTAQQLMERNLLPYSSMYRREAWLNTGGYRPRCRTAEDADFWTRLASYGYKPRMVTDVDTLIYRNRPGSMSRSEGKTSWTAWFPWASNPALRPAGAYDSAELPVISYDPVVVSVIIPVGPGHTGLVRDAIDSVEAQTFGNWECVVVNDSGADLPELPAWVRVLTTYPPHSDQPAGVAAARNTGIRSSSAPLFLPLDADDYLQPRALEVMVKVYRERREVVFADFYEDPDVEGRFTVFESPEYDAHNLTRGCAHCVTALTPRKWWEEVGGYDEKLPAWEDWDFQLAIADKGHCTVRVPMPLWTYRKWTGERRSANVKSFEESKAGILGKWEPVWNGEHELAACSTCGGRPVTPVPMTRPASFSPPADGEEYVLIQYTGNKAGQQIFRGRASKTQYSFGANEPPHYVLARDKETFENKTDFKVVDRPAMAAAPVETDAPPLVADGAPRRGRTAHA